MILIPNATDGQTNDMHCMLKYSVCYWFIINFADLSNNDVKCIRYTNANAYVEMHRVSSF